MLLQVASYLDPKVLYELAPRLWDFVAYALVVGLLSHEIFVAQFKKSKIFGSGSEKIAGIISVILALASAFTLNIQGISLIGVASSGWFNVLFGFIVGLIVYAFVKASFDTRKSLAISFISGAGVVVLLFGLDSIDSLAAKNLIGIVMWGGLFLMLFKTFEDAGESSAHTPSITPSVDVEEAESIEDTQEAIDDAENRAQAASHQPLFEESGENRVLSQAGSEWLDAQRAITDGMMNFAHKIDSATARINGLVDKANSVADEFESVSERVNQQRKNVDSSDKEAIENLAAVLKKRVSESEEKFTVLQSSFVNLESQVKDAVGRIEELVKDQRGLLSKALDRNKLDESAERLFAEIERNSRALTELSVELSSKNKSANQQEAQLNQFIDVLTTLIDRASKAADKPSFETAYNILSQIYDLLGKLEHDLMLMRSSLKKVEDITKDEDNLEFRQELLNRIQDSMTSMSIFKSEQEYRQGLNRAVDLLSRLKRIAGIDSGLNKKISDVESRIKIIKDNI